MVSLPTISFVIASGNGHGSQMSFWWFLRGGTTVWKDISCSDDEAIAYYLQVDSFDHTGKSRFGSAEDKVSVREWTGERQSNKILYPMRNELDWGFSHLLWEENWNNLLPWEMNSMGNWRKNVLFLLTGDNLLERWHAHTCFWKWKQPKQAI